MSIRRDDPVERLRAGLEASRLEALRLNRLSTPIDTIVEPPATDGTRDLAQTVALLLFELIGGGAGGPRLLRGG